MKVFKMPRGKNKPKETRVHILKERNERRTVSVCNEAYIISGEYGVPFAKEPRCHEYNDRHKLCFSCLIQAYIDKKIDVTPVEDRK